MSDKDPYIIIPVKNPRIEIIDDSVPTQPVVDVSKPSQLIPDYGIDGVSGVTYIPNDHVSIHRVDGNTSRAPQEGDVEYRDGEFKIYKSGQWIGMTEPVGYTVTTTGTDTGTFNDPAYERLTKKYHEAISLIMQRSKVEPCPSKEFYKECNSKLHKGINTSCIDCWDKYIQESIEPIGASKLPPLPESLEPFDKDSFDKDKQTILEEFEKVEKGE